MMMLQKYKRISSALLIWVSLTVFATNPTTKPTSSFSRRYCYTGSSMYQIDTVDCHAKDKEYTGVWYCAKMELCERFINTQRTCVTTRYHVVTKSYNINF